MPGDDEVVFCLAWLRSGSLRCTAPRAIRYGEMEQENARAVYRGWVFRYPGRNKRPRMDVTIVLGRQRRLVLVCCSRRRDNITHSYGSINNFLIYSTGHCLLQRH